MKFGMVVVAAVLLLSVPARAEEAAQPEKTEEIFARVGDATITLRQYQAAFANAARNKFYHGTPPQAEYAALQREVGQRLIDHLLLGAEAKRLAIPADEEEVRTEVERFEAANRNREVWLKNKDKLLPLVKESAETRSRIAKLENQVRQAVPAPGEAEVANYYQAHQDRFTEPEQVRVSVILLKVDPAAGKEALDKAFEEARDILARLKGGADFAETAKLRSADFTAEEGGDMGYQHKGMLAEQIQLAIDKLQLGEISEPYRVLDGVSIFRLEDRKEAKLKPLEEVRERARDLLQREQVENAWQTFQENLRKAAVITVNESVYRPLPEPKPEPKPEPEPKQEPVGLGQDAQPKE